ncbi:MAG: 3-oxoacyl-ACP synthase [Micavibrio aeruginosavorus]|uniref:Beta-ketoacyl-[acyl-carrier-protein] synthase III n=1 Tax=Micavibrio aeruginosavorus TaxID=349221 RepID=A0A2W5MU03_9BACT|nr:MAG: 3-oxoacyl-ACP synthase [Micavibrio aeruginosavorus]
MTRKAYISGTGSYLPEKILTNAELEKMVDTSDEWIVQRSGIKERHIAAKDESTADMAIKAARKAIEAAGITPDQINGIVVATTTPDSTFPAVAVKVQQALSIPPCLAFDVQAVCSGFVYALSTANAFIKSGNASCMLVIGAEKMSSLIDWNDRTTCVLFADGAGAVVLEEREPDDDEGIEGQGIHSTHLYANGEGKDLLYVNGGVSTTGTVGHLVMEGKEVFKYAVKYLAEIVGEVLAQNRIHPESIDWLVPHQANIRIIESTAKKLDMPMERVVVTIDRHGNTSAASIPLALDEAVRDGRIQRGHLVLLEAMGGGFTWGAALLRF